MRPLASCDCEFEPRRVHWISISCECYDLDISTTSWSLVKRSPTDCDVSFRVIEKPQEWGAHGLRWAAASKRKKEASLYKFRYIGYQSTYIHHFTTPPPNVNTAEGNNHDPRHATHHDGWWEAFKLKDNKHCWMLVCSCDNNNVPLHDGIFATEKTLGEER